MVEKYWDVEIDFDLVIFFHLIINKFLIIFEKNMKDYDRANPVTKDEAIASFIERNSTR